MSAGSALPNIDKKLFHTIYSSIDIRNSTCLGYNFLRSAPKKEHNFEEFSMPGSRLGEYFSVINFGESHGPAIGCVIDGCPPGMELSQEDIQKSLIGDVPERHVMSLSAKK